MASAAGKKKGKRKGPKRGAAKPRRAGSRARAAKAKPRAVAKPRVAAKKRAAKKRAAKRPRKRAAAKPAKRRTAARPARRAKAAPRKRASAKRAAPRVARRAAPPPPPAFSVQRALASAREELLFEMARARAAVKAAIQGLTAGTAMQPVASGKWSVFEIVLHLSERDRVRLEEFGRTLGGQPRSWAGIQDPETSVMNEAHLAPLRAHTWEEAVRRLDSLREELLVRLSEVPALPDDVWKRGHAFGDMLWGLPEHDRHHAEQIKQARIGSPSPAED